MPGLPGGRLTKTFASLKHRNFRLYFFGQMVSNTGNWLTGVALTLLVLNITHSGLDVGLLAACQFGPILLLSVWGGTIADRVDKRRMLFFTQSGEMLQSIGLAILAFMHHPPLAGLYGLAVVGGTLLAFDNPLRRSFVSEMVPTRDVPNAVVLYSTIVNTSRFFGPALAGLLIINFGYGWCFAIDAASYLAVIAGLFLMRPAELIRSTVGPRRKGEVRAGLRYVLTTPRLLISFLMLAIVGTLAYNFSVTLPLFVTDTLHRSSATFTMLYSIFAAGAVIGALIVAHRGLVEMKDIIFGAAALGVSMLLLGASPNLLAAAVVIFPVGMATVLYSTATTAMVQVEARAEMRGRTLALQTVLLVGTTPIGGPALGWLADAHGGRMPVLLGAVACLAAAAIGVYFVRLKQT